MLTTQRLLLREMTRDDLPALCTIMQDERVMYAYEGAFSNEEVAQWLERQLARYKEYGFGLWAVVLKETGAVIGQCGLTMQQWKDAQVLEVGYLFAHAFWRRGYATEAARACIDYAFDVLKADSVCSIIRDTNIASQNVATRNGLVLCDAWVKHYRGVDMPHGRYVLNRKP